MVKRLRVYDILTHRCTADFRWYDINSGVAVLKITGFPDETSANTHECDNGRFEFRINYEIDKLYYIQDDGFRVAVRTRIMMKYDVFCVIRFTTLKFDIIHRYDVMCTYTRRRVRTPRSYNVILYNTLHTDNMIEINRTRLINSSTPEGRQREYDVISFYCQTTVLFLEIHKVITLPAGKGDFYCHQRFLKI